LDKNIKKEKRPTNNQPKHTKEQEKRQNNRPRRKKTQPIQVKANEKEVV